MRVCQRPQLARYSSKREGAYEAGPRALGGGARGSRERRECRPLRRRQRERWLVQQLRYQEWSPACLRVELNGPLSTREKGEGCVHSCAFRGSVEQQRLTTSPCRVSCLVQKCLTSLAGHDSAFSEKSLVSSFLLKGLTRPELAVRLILPWALRCGCSAGATIKE